MLEKSRRANSVLATTVSGSDSDRGSANGKAQQQVATGRPLHMQHERMTVLAG